MLRLLFLLIFPTVVFSATIAIIDTGFDLDHHFLKPKLISEQDLTENSIDFHGWNFFDNSHLKTPVLSDRTSVQEVLLFRSLRAKIHQEALGTFELKWYKNKSSDKEFMNKVKLFKKHSHGTFVAGIALREGENINILPIRGLNVPENFENIQGKTAFEKFQDEIRLSTERISKKFSKIVEYVASKKIEVINASYGITYKSIMTKFRDRYKEMTGKEIDETQLKLLVDDYFKRLYERGEKTMLKHPNILFVFSAGNSGHDNDITHHYPSKIKVPNSITVAAMNGDYLATFSNYGRKNVDIGAPGVGILSILPKVYQDGAEMFSPASGTSMAAPYVANIAAQIINTNKKLKTYEVKRIILETGEEKENLKQRLISGSMVNNQKALHAALLSKEMALSEAIALVRSNLVPVEDKINLDMAKAISPEELQKKVLDSIPSVIRPAEVDEDPLITGSVTSSESFLLKNPETEQPDNSIRPTSVLPIEQQKSNDPIPSSQNSEQSQKLSVEMPASFSQPEPLPLENPNPAPSPSSP